VIIGLNDIFRGRNVLSLCECGENYNWKGICENCGLIDEDYLDLKSASHFPYDEESVTHHGDFRNHSVMNMAVMTRSNPRETNNPNLRRAIGKDSQFEWGIKKNEILKKNIKTVCKELNLPNLEDSCFHFLRKIRNFDFTGKLLEDIAIALVYLVIRMDGRPFTLFDFKRCGYDTGKIYQYYTNFIIKLGLYNRIKRQDPIHFIIKFINILTRDTQEDIKQALAKHIKWLFSWWFHSKSTSNIIDVSAFNNNSGLTMMGACLYAALKKDKQFKIKQERVANICGCSEVTLRDYIKELKEFSADIKKSG